MTLVFVYGSLKTGFGNNRLLQAYGAELVGLATTSDSAFRMYSLGAFPAVVEDNHGGKAIVGEVWEVNDECLAALDALEGNGRLYERRVVSVNLIPHATLMTAWMYVFLGNPDNCGASNCMDSRHGRPRVAESDRDFEWVSE